MDSDNPYPVSISPEQLISELNTAMRERCHHAFNRLMLAGSVMIILVSCLATWAAGSLKAVGLRLAFKPSFQGFRLSSSSLWLPISFIAERFPG